MPGSGYTNRPRDRQAALGRMALDLSADQRQRAPSQRADLTSLCADLLALHLRDRG